MSCHCCRCIEKLWESIRNISRWVHFDCSSKWRLGKRGCANCKINRIELVLIKRPGNCTHDSIFHGGRRNFVIKLKWVATPSLKNDNCKRFRTSFSYANDAGQSDDSAGNSSKTWIWLNLYGQCQRIWIWVWQTKILKFCQGENFWLFIRTFLQLHDRRKTV